MTITRKIATATLSLALAALLWAAPAEASVRADTTVTATNDATLTVEPTLNLTPSQALTWPNVTSGAGLVDNDQNAVTQLDSDPENDLSISVSVPGALTANGDSIPLSYGAASGYVSACDTNGDGTSESQTFDPTTSAPQISSCIVGDDGGGALSIGQGPAGADPVTADVGTLPAATYTATIDWTVTLN